MALADLLTSIFFIHLLNLILNIKFSPKHRLSTALLVVLRSQYTLDNTRSEQKHGSRAHSTLVSFQLKCQPKPCNPLPVNETHFGQLQSPVNGWSLFDTVKRITYCFRLPVYIGFARDSDCWLQFTFG